MIWFIERIHYSSVLERICGTHIQVMQPSRNLKHRRLMLKEKCIVLRANIGSNSHNSCSDVFQIADGF